MMSATAPPQYLPGDPKFIDQIVHQIKSQGIFDQWRRECLADVDTKPAYQNLTFRVDSSVASFLSKQKWRPDMVKNQMRENLRKHILELGIIEKGVDRIVEQVVQPKVLPSFHPTVENAIYDFLQIEKPKKKVENGQKSSSAPTISTSPRKGFRPMPVSVPSREQEDATPPPGEEFGLEAITPSPDSRADSATNKELADAVSDVSMEDSRAAPEGALERICSPISMQSNSNMDESDSRPASRVASALSAISSGDDLPSASPVGPSPVTPGDDNTMPPGEENDRSDSDSERSVQDEEDEESDFSSPEFEKLEITHPTSRTATPNPTEAKVDEEERKKELDDHDNWRRKHDSNGPDRKPDEDPGQSSAGTSSSAHSFQQTSTNGHVSSSTEPKTDTSNTKSMAISTEIPEEVIDAPEAAIRTEIITEVEVKSEKKRSKDRNRSRERKSDKKDDSHKDRHKNRHRDRDRDRKKERRDSERPSKSSSSKSENERGDRHRSSKKDKDRDRDRHRDRSKDRHRDKDRDRDRHRSKSESERGKSHREKDKKSDKIEKRPRSPPHPMAHLWKRPAEKPRELADWLSGFQQGVFDEAYDGLDGLTDVSVSPVSSYAPSDAESVIYLSDVDVDSELEELFVGTGGKILYKEEEANVRESTEEQVTPVSKARDSVEQTADWDHTPLLEEVVRPETADQHGNSKRIRKVNTRYSDSYVGSEFRKVIHMQHQTLEQTQRASRPTSGGRSQQGLRDYQHNVIGEPSPEEQDYREETEYGPSEPKRIKTEQPLPSSPESVQSDPSLGQANAPASPRADIQSPNDNDARKDAASPVNRRRSLIKQPQKRYDDTDLYKPRPVITPSSRRFRRQEDS